MKHRTGSVMQKHLDVQMTQLIRKLLKGMKRCHIRDAINPNYNVKRVSFTESRKSARPKQ
jgi:hypothetical protein